MHNDTIIQQQKLENKVHDRSHAQFIYTQAYGKTGLNAVSSQISLWSLHRLFKNDPSV